MFMQTPTPPPQRLRTRTSRPLAGFGFAVGVIATLFTIAVIIPIAGPAGVFATLLALAFTVYHGAALFARRGVARREVEAALPGEIRAETLARALRVLDGLHQDGLLSHEEFQAKRAEILSERW
jgi:hypothetical protein